MSAAADRRGWAQVAPTTGCTLSGAINSDTLARTGCVDVNPNLNHKPHAYNLRNHTTDSLLMKTIPSQNKPSSGTTSASRYRSSEKLRDAFFCWKSHKRSLIKEVSSAKLASVQGAQVPFVSVGQAPMTT
ncbi:hypothetical protein CDAR_559371 [Caerostris darwini]|uniref:Uncharacterized protein n=1 Tax=Caerostris darwini TaxID=1538125 RepID=A0AAV4P0P2_9ARAC|nr:hypothetical protein CDAR_559371 [Caerostris darwini]